VKRAESITIRRHITPYLSANIVWNRAKYRPEAKICQGYYLFCKTRRFQDNLTPGFWRLAWIYDMRQRRTAPGGSTMAKLLRLSLATLTFLVFFTRRPCLRVISIRWIGCRSHYNPTRRDLTLWKKLTHYFASVFWFSLGTESLPATTFSYSSNIACWIIFRVPALAGKAISQ
jgi:hypothetical protein